MKGRNGRRQAAFVLASTMAAASLGQAQQPVPAPVPASPGPQSAPVSRPPSSSVPSPTPTGTADPAAETSRGTVLFQSHGVPPRAPGEPADEVTPEPPGGPPGASPARSPEASPEGSPAESPNDPVAGSNAQPAPVGKGAETPRSLQDKVPDLTDREREGFTVTAYDLDLRLEPATSGLSARAKLTVRNDGAEPLRRVPLQVSSTLRWESAGLLGSAGARRPLELAQHTVETDADHTGEVSEAVLTLPEPLAPGATASLDVFYSGTLAPSQGRLLRLGATAEQAAVTDWDGVIAPQRGRSTALRGFGNVLWYPVVSAQLFLGNGNELFRAVDAMRRREESATVRLRVSVAYRGEAPAAVYFCAQRQAFKAHSEVGDAPVALGSGVATAEFPANPLGQRIPSLFVVERPELLVAPLPSTSADPAAAPSEFSSSAGAAGTAAAPARSAAATPSAGASRAAGALRPATSSLPESTTEKPPASASASAPSVLSAAVPPTDAPAGSPMLAVETEDEAALPALTASALRVAPLLMEWFGARPLSVLTVLDADGQPFQDGPLLRGPVASLGASSAQAALAHSLTAAWVQTGQPWMDEGLAEFMGLLWTERTEGRAAAMAQLADLMTPVNLAEPSLERPADTPQPAEGKPGPAKVLPASGEPLVSAADELYYRRKAAAVWWMLREIAGEDNLRLSLSAWRTQPVSTADAAEQAMGFEHLLEKTSGKELGAFFDDWVFHDRGLPDLTLVDVTPRQLPAGPGHDSGWLVAVTVRNDGGAMADVPLVVRSGTYSVTRRMRVPGASSVTERVLVESPPTEVAVNDGSTPEVRSSTHTRAIVARAR